MDDAERETNRRLASIDQQTTLALSWVPAFLRSFYCGLVIEGFAPQEALWLTGEELKAINSRGG